MTTPKTRKMRVRVCEVCGKSDEIRLDNKSEVCRSCATKKQHERQPLNMTHGMSGSSMYRIWEAMIQRCRNQDHPWYPKYGGRGITVCDEWMDFAKFYDDMQGRTDGFHLHRIDNDAGYSKDNCKWVSASQHNRIHKSLP